MVTSQRRENMSHRYHYLMYNQSGEEVATPLTIAVLKAKAAGEKYIVGWKKCLRTVKVRRACFDYAARFSVVELRIPITAKMRQPNGGKCRASVAEVVAIYDCNYDTGAYSLGQRTKRKTAVSNWSDNFKYKVGETIKPSNDFDGRNTVCASGIHFFLTADEAAKYIF